MGEVETNRESWVTIHPETTLENAMGGALVKRARKRHVWQHASHAYNEWLVLGDPKLSDSYPSYHVRYDGVRFECQCQYHAHGSARSKCSHIVAVMLFKRGMLPNNRPTEVQSTKAKAEKGQEVEGSANASKLPVTEPSTPTPVEFPYDILDLDDPPPISTFGDNPPLPAKFQEVFPHQFHAAVEIFNAFERGEQIVIAEAPPGTGKTLLGELVRRMLETPALYVCTTKSLQDQFMADFPYAKLLKGRSNYPTLDYPDRFFSSFTDRLTAADCQKSRADLPACGNCPDDAHAPDTMHCVNCHPVHRCPYEVAKYEALRAKQLAVINTSYFLAEVNHVGKFSAKPEDDFTTKIPHFGLIIMDEADLLESELLSQVEVVISDRMQKKYGINKPKHKTVETSWPAWADETYQTLSSVLDRMPESPSDRELAREKKSVEQLLTKLLLLKRELPNGGWVYDGYNSKFNDIIFRPIKVNTFGQEMIWKHGPKFLLMSGSFIDPQSEVEDLEMADA